MSTIVTFRTSEDVKKQAERIFNELGLSMSAALNMFLRASIQANNLPFRTRPIARQYSEEELDALCAQYADIRYDVSSALPSATTLDGSSIAPAQWFDDDEDDEFYNQWLADLQGEQSHA